LPVPLGNFNLSDPAHIDGKYRVLQRLGQGGYGTVYLCKSNDFEKNVAVKVLRRHDGDDLQTKRFLNEVKALGKCSHPGIIHVHKFSVTTDGASLYYVMDALNGHSLSQELEMNGPLAPRRLIEIFCQVFDALEHAHGYGIVHRDVKPSNIMLTVNEQQEEQAVLIDFGIMRASSPDVRLTATGDMLGTPSYMSPEQCQGTVADFRSDLYSTGCTIYEAATGRPPFEGDSYAILLDHMNNLPSNVPEYLNGFLQICMAKDRTARFASAKDAENALVEIGNTATIDVRVPHEKRPRTASTALSKGGRTRIVLALASLCVLSVVGMFLALSQRRDDNTSTTFEFNAGHNEQLHNAQVLSEQAKFEKFVGDLKGLCLGAEDQAAKGRVTAALAICQKALTEVENRDNKDILLFYPLLTRARIASNFCDDRVQLTEALDDTKRIIEMPGSLALNSERKARAHMVKARLLSRLGDDRQAGQAYERAIELVGGIHVTKPEWADSLMDYSNWLKTRQNNRRRIAILIMASDLYRLKQHVVGETSAYEGLISCDLSQEPNSVLLLATRMQSDASSRAGAEQLKLWQQSVYLLHSAKLIDEWRKAALTTIEISKRMESPPAVIGWHMRHLLLTSDFGNDGERWMWANDAYNETKPSKDVAPVHFARAAFDLARLERNKKDRVQALSHFREAATAADFAQQLWFRESTRKKDGDLQRCVDISARAKIYIVELGKDGGQQPTDLAEAERSIALILVTEARKRLEKRLHSVRP